MSRLTTGVIIIFIIALFIGENAVALEIRSASFKSSEEIPLRHTYNDENLSPHLAWSDVPPGTRSFVIICEDPDAPLKAWVHWIIFNIPKDTRELKEGQSAQEILDNGAIQGSNDFGNLGYDGPTPPPASSHRYIFKLYALDTMLNLKPRTAKKELLKAIQGHIIGEAKLIGTYGR